MRLISSLAAALSERSRQLSARLLTDADTTWLCTTTFLDLKTIEVDYRRYAHNVSTWRVSRLRHDTVILSPHYP